MKKKGCNQYDDDLTKMIDNDLKKGEKREIAIMESRLYRKSKRRYGLDFLTSPDKAALFGKKLFKDYYDRERIYVVGITAKSEPVAVQLVSIGTMDACLVDLRCIFRFAILSGAHSILLFHNHLSYDTSPSKEDLLITKRIRDAGDLMGIILRDHIIVGGENYYSMREHGELQ